MARILGGAGNGGKRALSNTAPPIALRPRFWLAQFIRSCRAIRPSTGSAPRPNTQQDLAKGSATLADAMQGIGLAKWSRFLGDAAGRAASNGTDDRTVVLAQNATPGITTDVTVGSGPAAGNSQEQAGFREQFEEATATAYRQYPNDCSHYLQTFLINMGFPDTPYRTANEFMRYVQQPNSGWRQVTPEEAVRLSAEGHIVIAGKAEGVGSGHVEVVGPKMIPAPLAAGHPMSPQVFSGSSSGWPGARSQGEHSLADGWPAREVRNVTLWVKE